MKALILAGGRGARINECSATKAKCMINVLGRPVIEYSLDYAVATDVNEIVVVVGYRAEEIIDHCGQEYKGRGISYVNQREQKGVVDAIECSRKALKGDDFLLLLADEVMVRPRHEAMLEAFRRDNLLGLCGIVWVEDRELIKMTYALVQDSDQRVSRLTEKPRDPPNNNMGTGQCVFKNAVLEYIEATPIQHERHEKELPGLVQCAIDDGAVVKSFPICDKFANINSVEDLAYAESILEAASR